ncbi:MAG: SDR family oxidoreductase [Firmicutes bacterium]|nr:SDR family oxidoreductase [Bacillota bacterium]
MQDKVNEYNVMQMLRLNNQVALVTGGARNLGFDMALALAEAGADVAITSRSLDRAAESSRKIAELTGRKVVPYQLDVRYEDQVIRVVDQVLADFGRIDILVNNAGNVVSTPENNGLERRPLEEWQNTIDVNLTGVFLCSKHVVARAMKPAKRGVIINLGSTAGMIGKDRRVYRGTNMGGVTIDYEAAKAGVINMTRDMACHLAPDGIRVNCISPAGFWRGQPEAFVKAYSETIPMGRMGMDGKEIKGAVVFLASEAASFITGVNLPVDGGLTAW